LWKFGIFCGNVVQFSRFGMLYQKKSGNPGLNEEEPHFQKDSFLAFYAVCSSGGIGGWNEIESRFGKG
jgi:hypothetical protein